METRNIKSFLGQDKGKIISNLLTIFAILFIMYLAMYVRSSTLDSKTVLDYDPWWWYRHAENIVENGMRLSEWDILSYYPPGRPVQFFHGWSYTIAILYKILNYLIGFSLTDTAKWSTLIVAAASTIPAFLLGKKISNNLGGILTALFGTLTPALIGVSMAGYCDTDMIVVFYSFLSVYSILLAIKKQISLKTLHYYIFAILVNLLFVFTWGFGWIILLFFTAFIPTLFVFRIIEKAIHERKINIDTSGLYKEKNIAKSLIFIIFLTNIIAVFLGFNNMIKITGLGFSFVGGKLLLVNISVAELQQINVFSLSGFNSLVGRVGLGPILFTMGLPVLPLLTSPLILFMIFKAYKKIKIDMEELFLLMWAIATFVLITRGVRFSLLFSTAAATTAGYIASAVPKYLKNEFLKVTFYGVVSLLALMFVSNAISTGYAVGQGMRVSENWYDMLDWLKQNADDDSLVVTWWDPGHIIAGYTGLKVHADGAHCSVGECIPYNHNDRIQDMGRVFAISDEDEAVEILEKYKELTPSQCSSVKEEFGNIVPSDACKPVEDMYVIASSDLIQKYYWLSYFGTGTGKNYLQMRMSNYNPEQGVISYGNGEISLVYEEDKWLPVLNSPTQDINNALVENIIYFENGEKKEFTFNSSQVIDGTIWVEPSYQSVIYMDPSIEQSIFNRMFFFYGDDLNNFELVYQNPEIKVFRVVW